MKDKFAHNKRVFKLMLIDFITAVISFLISSLLSFSVYTVKWNVDIFKTNSIISGIVCIAIFYLFGIYRTIWRYADVEEFIRIMIVSMVASTIFIFYGILNYGFSILKIGVANLVISALSFLLSRMLYRLYNRATIYSKTSDKSNSDLKNLAIIGAGQAGILLYNEIIKQSDSIYNISCIIDDDLEKIHKKFDDVSIEGPISDIVRIVDKYNIETIIVALPSADKTRQKEILSLCSQTKREVKYLPQIYLSIQETGKATILSQIKEVSIEDLLGREEVHMNCDDVKEYLSGKKVLVTGGGGSIGSELCRQIIIHNPKELTILDIYENNAYDIQMELIRNYGKDIQVDVIISSIRDKEKLRQVFKEKRPEIVFHAAAHKHVPLMERSPQEAIKNNVFGTLNVVEVSDEFKVDKFVLISTDKAVNPTNIMGATKRLAEMILQDKNKYSNTDYVAVRFGNVLGSNGSVIPLFKKQIEKGGPVTVTHPEITRYFMTIPEAVRLVLKASLLAEGGEIFVLDMGEPVKIKDLAENMIRLSGLKPYEDIQIEYTGLRPGEKLYEELLIEQNGIDKTKFEKIFVETNTEKMDSAKLKENLQILKEISQKENEKENIIKTMTSVVSTYIPKLD